MKTIIIRVLSIFGLLGTLYLSYKRYTGGASTIVGCGDDGGCADVLSSHWSTWLGLPVTTIAASVWLVVLATTFCTRKPDADSEKFRILQSILGLLLVLAALWFLSVMAIMVRELCVWCLALHLAGLIAGALLLVQPATVRHLFLVFPIAFVAFIALPLGQLLGPKSDTHVETNIGEATDTGATSDKRIVTFRNGEISLEVDALPIFGSADAPNIFVEFYDYTCGSCRTMHQELSALKQKHGDEFAVIMMPTPLQRKCNPYMMTGHDHPTACDKAMIALAAWESQPENFEKVHNKLMTIPQRTTTSKTLILLREDCDVDKLKAVLNSEWATAQLQKNLKYYQLLTEDNRKMPKLVLDHRTMHGLVKSTARFFEIMEATFAARQVPTDPAIESADK